MFGVDDASYSGVKQNVLADTARFIQDHGRSGADRVIARLTGARTRRSRRALYVDCAIADGVREDAAHAGKLHIHA